jgi:molecular chaperone IbpA
MTSLEQYKNFWIGFDDLFNRMDSFEYTSFPPYNIKKIDAENYEIEMAVAGFSKDDIEVKYAENTLTIKAKKKEKQDTDKLIYKGISEKNFTKSFSLADDFVVEDAGLQDGLLCVKLKKIIPEEKKEKIIDIK